MKRIKYFLLVSCIYLFLTGCSTEVVLKLDEDKVSETIKISGLKDSIYENGVMKEDIAANLEAFEREYEFYDTNEFETGNYIGKTYELTEEIMLWSELSHVRPCYDAFEFEKTETNISLETSDEYLCGYLFGATDVTLIIESDLEVISSNADKVEGNKLVWNINSDNYQNKKISFNYKILTKEEKQAIVQKKYTIYIFMGILALGAIILIYVLKKNKDSNKL